MKVIYIAGKYKDERGEFYVRMNIREAERVALFCWRNGAVAICPHKNTAGFGGAFGIPDETWLKGDLEIIKWCDAVYAINNWIDSSGAKQEIKYAEELGIPVLYNTHDFFEFIGKG